MIRDLLFNSILFLPLSYGLIFSLYFINKPSSLRINEPAINISHVLNQEMVQESDYRYLLEMKRRGIVPNRHVLKEFEDYYQLVVDSFPDQADSYGMLAYCQYYLGQENQAIKSYGSAIQINPEFMGYYYNLAVIDENRGDYGQAAIFAKRALEVPLPAQVQGILSSQRIYMLILAQMPGDARQNIIQYIEDQRQKALELLANQRQVSLDLI